MAFVWLVRLANRFTIVRAKSKPIRFDAWTDQKRTACPEILLTICDSLSRHFCSLGFLLSRVPADGWLVVSDYTGIFLFCKCSGPKQHRKKQCSERIENRSGLHAGVSARKRCRAHTHTHTNRRWIRSFRLQTDFRFSIRVCERKFKIVRNWILLILFFNFVLLKILDFPLSSSVCRRK